MAPHAVAPTELPTWFLALPDLPAAAAVADRVRASAVHVLPHPSGRPWLLGRWTARALSTGAVADNRSAVAVLGEHAATRVDAAAIAGRVLTTAGFGAPGDLPAGSYHLIARRPGAVLLRGGVSELRRVFTATVEGIAVASDRADVLAALLGSAPDPARVALHLLDPQTLYPLVGLPVWHGVDAVPAGCQLRIDSRGGMRTHRWWSPPEPVVPLAEAAPVLREELVAAVHARTRGRTLATSDLGGLDSTAVCSVAATRGDAPVTALTVDAQDPLADDVRWGTVTARELGIAHHVVPAERMPLTYEGLTGPAEHWDEPCLTAVDRHRWRAVMTLAVTHGSAVHLTGIGGDELLYGSVAHLHTMIRRRPREAWRRLRGFAAKYRWTHKEAVRQLADRRPYRAWLHRVADDLTAPPPSLREPMLDWGTAPRLPPWTTAAAVEAVRSSIRDTAADAEPLAPVRGLHRELEAARALSRTTRQLQQMAAAMGLDYAAPYYDDRVVEAALRIDPFDRITPWRYKPIIVEAMRGVVPEASRCRDTKANAMVEEETGLRRHRADLLDLCAESRLAGLGLIDAAAFRAACDRPVGPGLQIGVLHQTLACEVWLRSIERPTVTV